MPEHAVTGALAILSRPLILQVQWVGIHQREHFNLADLFNQLLKMVPVSF